MKKTTLTVLFAMFLVLSTSAFATVVPGTANLWGAISLSGAGDGSGTAPPVVGVTGGTQVTILSTTITPVSCSPTFCAGGNGADGGIYADLPSATAIAAPGNGISGITFTQDSMFLVGVFINSGAPPTTGAGPATLNYGTGGPNSTTNDASDVPTFSPALNEVFFIGDGTEGFNGVCPGATVEGITCTAGQAQMFFVPTGANELFLGFADGGGESGGPAFYGDNSGSLNTVVALSSVPEPGTMMLMGLGLAACALLRKKLA